MDTFWLSLAAALAVAIPSLGTASAQSRIGPAISGTLAGKPELSATAVLLVAIPETLVSPGVVVAVLLLLRQGG